MNLPRRWQVKPIYETSNALKDLERAGILLAELFREYGICRDIVTFPQSKVDYVARSEMNWLMIETNQLTKCLVN